MTSPSNFQERLSRGLAVQTLKAALVLGILQNGIWSLRIGIDPENLVCLIETKRRQIFFHRKNIIEDGLLIQPLIGSLPNIMASNWFEALKRAAEGRRLMILDTLRRFHIEEENASGPMAQVIGRMEAIAADTGCSIVFLHHASKGATMMGAGDQQQASRGSSVLVDNIRWQSYLSGMTAAEAEEWGVDDSQRPYFVRYGVSKANYGAPFKDRWFRRHDGGVLKPAVLEKQRKSKGVRRGEA